MTDDTQVIITIRKCDEFQFHFNVGFAPHERREIGRGDLVELHYNAWSHPACHEFHFDGIPFTGFHRQGESFEPHRMCGDGNASLEIYCDREAHLYVLIDEKTGLPNAYSANAVREFLDLERSAKEGLVSPTPASVE